MNTIEQFIKKYRLDNFKIDLDLKGKEKVEFYNDLNDLFKRICRLFDKFSNISSMRGIQLLMALAKLSSKEAVINKSDIKKCLNLDRLEKLMHAFEYLEKKDYIKVKEKTPKFHIVKLNKKDNPDLILFQDLIETFWTSPREKKENLKEWIDNSKEK